MIYQYTVYQDAITTKVIHMPSGDDHQRIGTELATVDGITYVYIPDDAVLPADQPEQIAASIKPVTLIPELRNAIANASPHVKLIRQRVRDKIEAVYSVADEIKLLRTAPSAEFEAYNAYAEECRAWGRAEKTKIGL